MTFKGTRIFVKDVLEMLEDGWDWERISAAWDGCISRAAIAEAIKLARQALLEEKKGEKRQRAT